MSPADPTGVLTVLQFLQSWLVANSLLFTKQRNIAQYLESAKIWEAATNSPRICDINHQHVNAFLLDLRTRQNKNGEPIADSTIRKHCVALQYILDRAGPRTRHNPDGKGLVAEAPYIQKPTVRHAEEVEDAFTLPEIALWLEGCQVAAEHPWPGCMPTPTWWRASILIGYITGMRLESLMALRRSWIVKDAFGIWVRVPTNASKTRVGYRCFLGEVGMDAVQRVLCGSKREEVFELRLWHTTLHKLRRWMMAQCDFPAERRFGWHALRKACASELAPINEMASSMQLGHAKGGVTRDHYVTRRKILAQAVSALPMPDWQWPAG